MMTSRAPASSLSIHARPAVQVTVCHEIPDRYELKYLISESQVDAVRRAIEPYCVLDPFCEKMPGQEYGIASLYLDTPNRDLFRISAERRARHWKARVRLYDGADSAFLELKNKDHDMIKKQRVRIPLAGWVERLHQPIASDASSAERIFRYRRERYGLVPTLMVHYRREAWLSAVDSYARVTFDRCIAAGASSEWSLDLDDSRWLALDGASAMAAKSHGVVLELKCLTAVPRWLSSVVQSVGLVRTRYSKYCKGVERHFGQDSLHSVLNQL